MTMRSSWQPRATRPPSLVARPFGIAVCPAGRRGPPLILLVIFHLIFHRISISPSQAADIPIPPALAVPVDGEPFPARLASIAEPWRITFQAGDQRRVLTADELAWWGCYRDAETAGQLVLADGGLLSAEVLAWTGDALRVEGVVCGQQSWPPAAVRGMLLDPPLAPLARDRLLDRIRAARGTEDQLWLNNGDTVTGSLKSWRATEDAEGQRPPAITLTVQGRDLDIPLDNVVAVVLNPALAQRPPSPPAAELGFRDGSLLRVGKVVTGDSATQIALAGGLAWELPTETFREEVTLLRPSGKRVVYLSDLPAVGYKHIPFLEVSWPLQLDHNVLGGRLRSGGRVWGKGLGMHSTARVAYDLGAADRRFQAELALDDQAGQRGSVTFRVLLADAAGQWQRAYESPIVRGGDAPVPITVALGDAQRLVLIVESADQGDVLDHANWLNARLVR